MQIELSDMVKIINRIEALESKVAMLEARLADAGENPPTPANRPLYPTGKISDKYKGLAEYLYERWDRKIELTYAQIEEILGFSLPPTAYNLPYSFWANTETHSYAKGSWLAVEYKAKVVGDQKILFERNLYGGKI